MKKKTGFTLMELVVVVAILAVLGLLLVPRITNYLESSRAVVCQDNIRQVKNMVQLAWAQREDVDPEAVIANQDQAYFNKTVECPSGGIYVSYVSEGNVAIICTVHQQASDLIGKALSSFYTMREDYLTLSDNEFLTKYGIKKTGFRNDTYREELIKQFGESRWPALSDSLMEVVKGQLGSNTTLVEMPYATFGKDSNGSLDGGVYVYAAASDGTLSDKGSWNAYLIYSPYSETWYKTTKINYGKLAAHNIAGKKDYTIQEMEAWLQSSDWEAVK